MKPLASLCIFEGRKFWLDIELDDEEPEAEAVDDNDEELQELDDDPYEPNFIISSSDLHKSAWW